MQSPRRAARPRREPLGNGSNVKERSWSVAERGRETTRNAMKRVRLHAQLGARSVPPLLAETRRMAIFLITMLIVVITAPYYGNEMWQEERTTAGFLCAHLSIRRGFCTRRDTQKRARTRTNPPSKLPARMHMHMHARTCSRYLNFLFIVAGRNGRYT